MLVQDFNSDAFAPPLCCNWYVCVVWCGVVCVCGVVWCGVVCVYVCVTVGHLTVHVGMISNNLQVANIRFSVLSSTTT